MQNRGECLSTTEANQNYSKVDDEAMRLLVDFVARRVLNRYRAAFEEPAK